VSVPHGQRQEQRQRQSQHCRRSWFPPFAKDAKDGAPSFAFADAKSNAALRLGVHVGAEDGVDAGLVAGVLAEPAEQVGVEADGDYFFGHRHDNLGVFPEGFVGRVSVGIGGDAPAYLGIGHAAQLVPVGGGAALLAAVFSCSVLFHTLRARRFQLSARGVFTQRKYRLWTAPSDKALKACLVPRFGENQGSCGDAREIPRSA